jgi:hypothetical protein
LAIGQQWVRRALPKGTDKKGKIVARYRIIAVLGNCAVCDLIDEQGRVIGLRVFLPDNFLTRMEPHGLEQLDLPL